MVFTIIALIAIAGVAFYIAKRTKSNPESITAEPSIHQELAKTVAETKKLVPIVETPATKEAAKTAKKPATAPAQKRAPRKPKTEQ